MRANTKKIFDLFEDAGISKEKLPKPDEIEKWSTGEKWESTYQGYRCFILKRGDNNYRIKLPKQSEMTIK